MLVAGIGHPDRGDDGVGAAVAAALAGRLPPDVGVLARSGDMLALLDDCVGFDALICVDAAAPMGTPGKIHRIDTAVDTLPCDASFASSHALGLAEAIELARTLGTAPPTIIVYAIEGASFDDGAGLSAPVAHAVGEAARHIVAEVERLRRHVAEETST
ncbi:hydrogenase maturation protease [Rhodanobacter ginsengisoli]|uniref:Hydrogenase maturation protease n=1 Tax=Rhodanobacter ginsengisoli TaxID=418646 RepID=A0ABW0QNQ5_9GAMM